MATGTPAPETTFQRYNGTRARNYCTNPTIDVPILTPVNVCRTCDKPVRYDAKVKTFGAWVHVDGTSDHHVAPKLTCRYCGCNDQNTVVYRQHAWYDAVECARCGGVHGCALGD